MVKPIAAMCDYIGFGSDRFLMDWNEDCFDWAMAKLHKKPSISRSGSYQKEYDPGEFLDLRNTVTPKNYMHFEAIKPLLKSETA